MALQGMALQGMALQGMALQGMVRQRGCHTCRRQTDTRYMQRMIARDSVQFCSLTSFDT